MTRPQKYVIDGIIAAFLILFDCWLIGYFANALWGTKFDLQSVWNGFAVLGGAGMLAMARFAIDSFANSPKGEGPYKTVIDTVKEKIGT